MTDESNDATDLLQLRRPGPARANYSSFLPDVYAGSPNRVERYMQYDTMDMDSEVNAALDILAEFCTQKLKDNKVGIAFFVIDHIQVATFDSAQDDNVSHSVIYFALLSLRTSHFLILFFFVREIY